MKVVLAFDHRGMKLRERLLAELDALGCDVLDPLMRRVDVVAHGAPDSVHLGNGHRRADAGAADEDSALGVAVLDQPSQLSRLVGIVDPDCIGVDTQVERLVSERIELWEDDVA